MEITLREAETDLHSMMATCIQNPAWRMVKLLNTMRDAEGNNTIDGFYDDVRPLNQLEIDAVSKSLPDNEVLKKQYRCRPFYKGKKSQIISTITLYSKPTCNIAGISSGFTSNGSKTVLPREAVVKIDMRLVPGQTRTRYTNIAPSSGQPWV